MSYKQKSPIAILEGGTNTQSFVHVFGVAYYDGASLNNIDPGTSGYVLTSNGAGGAASFQAVSASGSITTIDGDSGSITPTAGVVTINGGTTGLTTSGSGSTMSLTGTLIVGNGGTGVTSVTTAPTATAFAGWDASSNMSANSFIPGYTTTATANGTTTLTVASTFHQFFTGTLSQTVQMPVTSTLVLGQQYQINNNSSASITIVSSGSNNIQVMAPGSQIEITCILTSGTTASSWDVVYSPGFSLYPTAGALVTNSSGVISDATGTSGYVLTSNGSSTAPSFQAPAGGGFTWNNTTGSTQTMAVGNGYVSNDGATLVTFTLPSTAAVDSLVAVQGAGSGLWTIAQNSGQTIAFNAVTSTSGATGSVSSTSQFDSITLICITANTGWAVNQATGNLSVV